MIDLGAGLNALLPWFNLIGSGGLLALCIRLYLGNRKLKIEAGRADFDIEKHRDKLTFELLQAARSEISALRLEVERLQPNGQHLRHFEAALDHLEALLSAGTEEERAVAERQARAFLNRMRRLREASGVLRNEVQRLDSTIAIQRRDLGEGDSADE